MKELFTSIFKTTEERIKNPFVGAFATSWLLFNWKAMIILLFSNKTIEGKIFSIETNYTSICNYLILPFLSAIFFIAIRPFIDYWTSLFLKRIDFNTNDLLTEKQIRAFENANKVEQARKDLLEKREGNNTVDILKKDVEVLQSTILSKDETISSLQQDIIDINKEYSARIKELTNRLSKKHFLRPQDEIFAKARKLADYLGLRNSYITIFESGLKILNGRDQNSIPVNVDLDEGIQLSVEELDNKVGLETFTAYSLEGEIMARPLFPGE